MHLRLLHPIAGLLFTGCIPLPYAVPPARVNVGTGAQVVRDPTGSVIAAPFSGSVGVFPLGIDPGQRDRAADFGLGGLYVVDANSQRGGVFLDVGPVARQWFSGEHVLRLLPELEPRILVDAGSGRWGPGAAVRFGVEWSTFFTPFDYASSGGDGAVWGVGKGEAGFGLYVEAAASWIAGVQTWSLTAGVSFRLPALAGIAFVPIPGR